VRAIDSDKLGKLREPLGAAFYILMFMAFATALSGSTRYGLLLLTLGSCAHVGRAAIGEFLASRTAPLPRSRPQRPARAGSEAGRARRRPRAVA
jgi:hypothetical protein